MTFKELNLPNRIYKVIQERCKEQGGVFNINSYSMAMKSDGGFDWSKTREGQSFWIKILEVNGDKDRTTEERIEAFNTLYPENKVTNHIYDFGKHIYTATINGEEYKVTIQKL